MKKSYGIFLGIGLIVVGILTVVFLRGRADEKDKKKQVVEQKIPVVSTTEVNVGKKAYTISATGMLSAKERIELFSEVQGILLPTNPSFKTGNRFAKGSAVLKVDAEEYRAQVQSSKSGLVAQIAAMLPDMEIEFPEAAKKWENYLRNFKFEGNLEPLPSFSSDAEKFFVTGRSVSQTYFNVKNQQERLTKYAIRAPFNGVVTEVNVNAGSLVRSGQKLGEFMDDSMFELRLAIPAKDNRYLKIGKKVFLTPLEETVQYEGRISRINPKINQQTQTIEVFVEIRNRKLKDGQYLEAYILGAPVDSVFTVNSNLLTESGALYIVKDSTLKLQHVEPINYVGDSIVVKGLVNGQRLLLDKLAGAYPGMRVEPKMDEIR